jgi:hypothetical protein
MLNNKKILFSAYALVTLMVAVIILIDYSNKDYPIYLTFTTPIINLLQEKSIYEVNPLFFPKVYLYSPFFALIVGVLKWTPDLLGMFIWDMLNLFVLFRAIHLFFENNKDKLISVLILIPAIMLSTHHHQSNSIIAGCILLTLYYLRKDNTTLAAFCTAICLFIKFYGFAAIILCLFFNCRMSYIIKLVGWVLLFSVLPLLFVSPHYLLSAYAEWWAILKTVEFKIQPSFMSLLDPWFQLTLSHKLISIAGLSIFLFPLTNIAKYKDSSFQNLIAASLLITVIIFNKMATSPTYIIASVGVCVWWANLRKKSFFDWAALSLVILLQILSLPYWPTVVMNKWLFPYSIIVIPYFLIWAKTQIQFWQMETYKKNILILHNLK